VPDDREGLDATLAAAAVDDTLAAPAIDATGATLTGDAGAITARTVGDDLREATIDRFGQVDRDRFELLGELARGGLGRVFRARDPRTGRVVALKEVLRPTKDIVARFAREAMVTANLQHPSIIPVYEVGRWRGGEPFYAMKLVRGRALDAIIVEAVTTEARIALVPHVIDVADALAYAHSEHVIHRDLKPANVLVGPYGETVVIDWGLARNLVTDHEPDAAPVTPPRRTVPPGQTLAGSVVGTPAYMPPEQAAGQLLDERADVYAIGAILYHVLSGVRPYAEHRTVEQILGAVEAGPPRPLDALVAGVPRELAAIVTKAMARGPGDRYASAEGLAHDLRRFQAGQLVGAHRYSTGELLRRWAARNRATVLTAAIALCALIGFGVVSVRRIASERDEAQRQGTRADLERVDADQSRALAERRFGDSLEELGRQAALAGAPERALPFLVAAAGAQPTPTPAVRLLLGQTRAAFAGLIAVAPAHRSGALSGDLADGGRLIVTTSGDHELRAWDRLARRVAWEATGVHHVAASPDGRWILAAADRGVISIRRATDGAVHHEWTVPPAPDLWSVLTWSPTGDRFALGSTGGRVAVGTVDGAELGFGPRQDQGLWTVSFAPGGAALATVSADGALRVRDPLTGAVRRQLVAAPGGSVACAWLDDARLVSVDTDGVARLWRVATGTVERRFDHGAAPYGLVVDPHGAWLLTFGDRALAKLWDLRTGALRASLPGHHLGVYTAARSGDWLVTADEAGGLSVWDPATGAALQALPIEGLAPGLVARGGLVLAFDDARPRLWRLAPEQLLRRIDGHTARIRDLTFDHAGTTVWTASNDDSARGTNLTTGATIVLGTAGHVEPTLLAAPADPRTQPPSPHGLRSLALSPDDSLVVTTAEDGTIAVWDAHTGATRGTWLGHTGRVRRLIFARDGKTAYSVGDSTLRRWDVASGRELARAELGELAWDVALVGDGTVASFTDGHGTVALWDAQTLASTGRSAAGANSLRALVVAGDRVVVSDREHLTTIDAHGAASPPSAFPAAFAGDAAAGMVAVGNAFGEIAIYDQRTMQPVRRWRSGDPTIASLELRPDGAVIAAASGRRVQLWSLATGRLLVSSPEVPAVIAQIAWSPDGTRLAFGGGSGSIWVWDTRGAGGELERFARCVSPWRLVDGALAASPFEPETCDALPR